ncbi:hypothetical protein EVU96_09180 [Bacillus infantis]|uniref:hypothetical protein n=1 Tax=Bacillus infantis TaxID=324767 RepID=UPI00101C6CE4|nr:hypothetical protein [Bacillus infantis]RYI30577.1 hypothetical protein EVU96_09180 [Bacillus infantis]
MKKISIYHHSATNLHDISLTDLNTDQVELYTAQGLTSYTEVVKIICDIIQQFNMQPNDKIVNYYFDEFYDLQETIRETVQEYLN